MALDSFIANKEYRVRWGKKLIEAYYAQVNHRIDLCWLVQHTATLLVRQSPQYIFGEISRLGVRDISIEFVMVYTPVVGNSKEEMEDLEEKDDEGGHFSSASHHILGARQQGASTGLLFIQTATAQNKKDLLTLHNLMYKRL